MSIAELPPQTADHPVSIAHAGRCDSIDCRRRWNAYNAERRRVRDQRSRDAVETVAALGGRTKVLRRQVDAMASGPERAAASAVLRQIELLLQP